MAEKRSSAQECAQRQWISETVICGRSLRSGERDASRCSCGGTRSCSSGSPVRPPRCWQGPAPARIRSPFRRFAHPPSWRPSSAQRRAEAPVVSQPRAHARSEVTPAGLRVRVGGAAVALSSVGGAHRRLDVLRARRDPAHRLRAGARDGRRAAAPSSCSRSTATRAPRTWSWRLGTSLEAGLQKDGMVAFHAADGRDTGLRIAPVALLDVHGRQITPEHLRWSLARRDGAQFLELRLDDSSLPVPYLIDPAVTTVTFAGSSMVAGATATGRSASSRAPALVAGTARSRRRSRAPGHRHSESHGVSRPRRRARRRLRSCELRGRGRSRKRGRP